MEFCTSGERLAWAKQGERVPLGLARLEVVEKTRVHSLLWAGTWRRCSGHGRTTVREACGRVMHAAAGGRLEVLQWARAHGCPWIKHQWVLISHDHHDTLAWVQLLPEYDECLE
jgi:hypothetical protein